jgi:hypothetical protein
MASVEYQKYLEETYGKDIWDKVIWKKEPPDYCMKNIEGNSISDCFCCSQCCDCG